MLNRSLLLVFACASASAAAADVYKWTDAGGVVHYSDTEPAPELNAQRLYLSGATTSEVATPAAKPGAEGEAARPEPKPLPGQLASAAQSAERRCDQARNNLEVLQSKFTVGFDAQGNGKPEVLDAAARQAQVERAQTLIATYCR